MPKGMTTLHKNHVMTDQMDSAKCHDRENAVSQCNFYAACRAQRGAAAESTTPPPKAGHEKPRGMFIISGVTDVRSQSTADH